MIYGKALLLEAAKRKPQRVSPISFHAVSLSLVSFSEAHEGRCETPISSNIFGNFSAISSDFSPILGDQYLSWQFKPYPNPFPNLFQMFLFVFGYLLVRLKPLSWGGYISLTPSSWSTAMGYRNGLLNGVFLNGLLSGVFLNGLLNGLSI